MTTSKTKATVGHIKGIVAPNQEGYIDLLSLPVNGKPLGQVLDEMESVAHTLQGVIKRLDLYKTALKEFLDSRGYKVSSNDFNAIIGDLQSVKTLNPLLKHKIALLHEGYITDIIDIELEQIITDTALPLDVRDGYYQIKDGKVVVDEKRKEEMEGLE